MRTLTAGMLAEIAKTITDPIFLIKIDFGSKFVHATTREILTYNTDEYNYVGAQMRDIDGTRVRFTLNNFDREISTLALAGQIQGNSVEVYLHYNGETIGRFSGLLDKPVWAGDYNTVGFTCVSEYSLNNVWPAGRLRPPVANHLPVAGTIIELGPWEITLERDLG
jgi:hypothetical protein